jgi:hypothetical protein
MSPRPALVVCVALVAWSAFANEQLSARAVCDGVSARGDVVFVYQSLTKLTVSERKEVFATLSTPMKMSLWVLQLETVLWEHVELSDAQRGVLNDALLFLRQPALFPPETTVSNTTAEMERPTHRDLGAEKELILRRLTDRALRVFGTETTATLFGRLGPVEEIGRPNIVTNTDCPIEPSGRKIEPLAPACTCNPGASINACSFYQYCENSGCIWSHTGCGWFWLDYCVGRCKLYPG